MSKFLSHFFLFFLLIFFLSPQLLHAEIKLYYEIYYGSIKLGESQITINDRQYMATAQTTGIGNVIYPYTAKWTTEIDKDGYPLKSIIYSKDRFKEREKIITFEKAHKRVIIEKILPKKKDKSISLPFPLYDELTAFITSWSLNYVSNPNYELPLYVDEERHPVKITFKRNTSCTFENQNFTCWEIRALLPEKSELLKRSREVYIVLFPQKKIPIEIRGVLPIFGSLTAKLKKYSQT